MTVFSGVRTVISVFSVEAPEPDRAGRGRQRLVRRPLLVDESVQRLVRGLFVVASVRFS